MKHVGFEIFLHLINEWDILRPDAQGTKNKFSKICQKCNLYFRNLEIISYVYADKPLIST